jgi:hypothetical protein
MYAPLKPSPPNRTPNKRANGSIKRKWRSDVKANDDKTIEQMREAIKKYAGPMTKCPAGKARAPVEVVVFKNKSVEWLKQNRNARPVRNKKAMRRKKRMARAQQQRIAKRNAAVLSRVGGRQKVDLKP